MLNSHVTRTEASDPDVIAQGFFLTRSMKDTMERYDEIMENQPLSKIIKCNGDIKLLVPNSDDRDNITHRASGSGQLI